MAIKTLEDARDNWRLLNNPVVEQPNLKPGQQPIKKEDKLRPELELYFEMSLGSVYESSGKDDIAIGCYMRALLVSLPKNHPDEAFPYCGLGSVLYHIDEPAWALRCYLMAREIRE